MTDTEAAVEKLVHDLRYEHRAVKIIRTLAVHGALVEACELALDRLDVNDNEGEEQEHMDVIRAALKLARGEA